MNDPSDFSVDQKQYIESKSGAGMSTTSRSVCEHCDMGKHNECTISNCYCAENGHRMITPPSTAIESKE
jgi:hypothetical protein